MPCVEWNSSRGALSKVVVRVVLLAVYPGDFALLDPNANDASCSLLE